MYTVLVVYFTEIDIIGLPLSWNKIDTCLPFEGVNCKL
jgi:hypothetical protein